MNKKDFNFFKELVEAPSPSGFEQPAQRVIRKALADVADDIRTDVMGNVVAHIGGPEGAPRLMLAGHCDEIGFMVSHVDDKTGFLRIHPIGGFDPKTLIAQRVTVHGKKRLIGVIGSKPIHIMTRKDRETLPKLEDLHVDLGLPAKAVVASVTVGDMVTLEQSFLDLGDCVTVKNHVMVFDGVTIEDCAFIGPGAIFTNDHHPRSRGLADVGGRYAHKENWLVPTTVRHGASIGAGAVILCGVTVGRYAGVGAGAVVTRDIRGLGG